MSESKPQSESQAPLTAEQAIHDCAVDLCRDLYDRFVMGGWGPEDVHDEAVKRIAEAYHAAKSREQGWVSVEERLPKEGEFVLGHFPERDMDLDSRVRACWIDRGKWEDEIGECNPLPTHWRPLPAPPKE